ncbi:MAG: hypothetical protein FJY95_01370 [Candidatus Handelsmanbacteria bacterium]|nr:hypothetical protein [Candidatus Handelsmanbacteria bacterium]
MVPARTGFAPYLFGAISLERPPFFYAYGGMWLHLLLGLVLVPMLALPFLDSLSAVVIASLSLGIIVYSVLAREYGLLINVLSYGLSLVQFTPLRGQHAPLMTAAILIAVASCYLILSQQYRRYIKEVFGGEHGIPMWIAGLALLVLITLFLYGLTLVNS